MEAVQWIISAGINVHEAIQLNDVLSSLRGSLPKARLLIARAEWGRFKNDHLADQLSQLKDVNYDAEDLLRQFDDQELRHKMEDANRSRAGRFISYSLRVAKDLLNGTRKRIEETHNKLDKAMADVEGMLSFSGLDVAPVQLMPETTSALDDPEVFGRDKERDDLIDKLGVTVGRESEQNEMMRLLGVPLTMGGRGRSTGKRPAVAAASTSICKKFKVKNARNLPVLAIVGIGGVGKTTLARFIYGDARVKAHFHRRIWVCVSDLFDKRRILKEIIRSIAGEECSGHSLDTLQEELKQVMAQERFLLVLDDIWPLDNDGWKTFFALLKHGPDGSMILVTTRSLEVARSVTTIEPLQLEGLPTSIFWEFFKKCAFGREDPEAYPQLQVIGQSIAARLHGSPLAAKTLGRLLNMELTVEHWMDIRSSELWELSYQENEILPALQLSYLYLPKDLKKCFAFCSMFPKDYSFGRDQIVDIWVAQGFIGPRGSGTMRQENIGRRYLDDLRSRFLLQTDARFVDGSRLVMHDLIHDMAQSVSVDECFLMQDLSLENQRRMPHTVRHMSIEVNYESFITMAGLHHMNKLRSLRFGARIQVEIPLFNQLSNILFLSLNGCSLVKLPDSVCDLNSLRCLDISHSRIKELPENLWCLYNLQYFYADHSSLKKIHPGLLKLTNLRSLTLTLIASLDLSRQTGLRNLSSLRNLSYFSVGKKDGRRISELKGMNQLSGALSIKWILQVRSKEEAAEARLVDKHYLKEIVLQWREARPRLRVPLENGVMEGLHPPCGIERLKVEKFGGDIPPGWLQPQKLASLRSLELERCPYLRLVPANFPCLERLMLDECEGVEALTTFANDGAIACLPNLQELTIRNSPNLIWPREMVLPSSLLRLSISDCPGVGEALSSCLTNLTSLTLLSLEGFHNVKSIPLSSMHTDKLRCLVLWGCSELSSIGGPDAVSPIQYVDITGCPKLTEVQQPLRKNELSKEEVNEIARITRV